MADEKLSISSFKELALILGLGGGMAGSTYLQNQSIKDQVLSNKELSEQIRDSLAVKDMLAQQRDLDIDVRDLKAKFGLIKKDVDWLSAVCERKDK